MRNQRLLIRPLVLVALALAVLLAVAVGLVYFTLDAPGRAQFARLLAPRAALLVLAWALGVVAAMAALQRWWVPRVSALPELAEQTRALVNASAPLQLKARAQADQQPLADAVNALAALFEDENDRGLKAVVSETFTDARHKTHNARRYFGEFLNFVTTFVRAVDPQQMAPNRDIDEGFQDRVRKMAQARRKNPDLFKLLHGIVTVEVMLDFMRQAEAIK